MPPCRSRSYSSRPERLFPKMPGEPRSPRKRRADMSETEKMLDDIKKIENKSKREAKKEWEAELPEAWKGPRDFKWEVDTIGIYKSDAKSSYGLTEREVLTLPHESIEGSPKTFFRLTDVVYLSIQKDCAGCGKNLDVIQKIMREVRLWKRTNHTKRRFRTNWFDLGYVGGMMLDIYTGALPVADDDEEEGEEGEEESEEEDELEQS